MGDDDQQEYWPLFLSRWAGWCDTQDVLVAFIFGWPLVIIGPLYKRCFHPVMVKAKKRRMRRQELRQQKAHEKAAELHRQKSNPLRPIKRNVRL